MVEKLNKIRFSGRGGQGIVVSSVIFANAAILDGYQAIQTQSYGPEQRGGRLKSDVIISYDKSINYPVIDMADVLIAMSQEAYSAYGTAVSPDGLVLINSSLVKPEESPTYQTIEVPATKMANDLGNVIVANMVMVGVLISTKQLISLNAIKNTIKTQTPKKFISINLKAFDLGLNLLK